jgi:hypothetical protein
MPLDVCRDSARPESGGVAPALLGGSGAAWFNDRANVWTTKARLGGPGSGPGRGVIGG